MDPATLNRMFLVPEEKNIEPSGRLPVRVLVDRMLSRFETIAPDFLEEVVDEIQYHGFRPEVIYTVARGPIKTPCMLREHRVVGTERIVRTIEIEESFLQFLWCIAFSTNLMHQELLVQPLLIGQQPRTASRADPKIQVAARVSEAGSLLMKELYPQVHYDLPNPENPEMEYAGYIEVANQLFVVASCFIMLHEVGHQFLGHREAIPGLESKAEEHRADRYAADWIKRGLGNNMVNDVLLSTGTMVAMLALLLLHSDLDGGPEHPNPDERTLRILEHFDLSDNDPIWSFGIIGLPAWIATHRRCDLTLNEEIGSMKDLFVRAMQQLVQSRRSNIQ